jgi:WD40 repeat protein
VFRPTVSADGRRIVTLSFPGSLKLWTLESGRPVGLPRSDHAAIEDAELSPDGRTVAVLESGAGIVLLDAATLRRRAVLADSETTRYFAHFTGDGRHVLGGGLGGRVRIWSAETGRLVGSVFAGNTEEVLWPSMSPDHRMLATGSVDGTIRLFDLASRRPLGVPLPGLPNRPAAPLFTPDGAQLLAITTAGDSYRWDVRPSAWTRHACAVAGRPLTRSEWNEALPGRPYAPACG